MPTQAEAKRKWCPFTRVAVYHNPDGGYDAVYNRGVGRDEPKMACLGSDCMAWRVTNNRLDGYCGLAGRE